MTGSLDAGTHLGEAELLFDLLQIAGLQTQLDNRAEVPGGACMHDHSAGLLWV